MKRVGIGRLMASIALLASTFGVYRSWSDASREPILGELAPTAMVALGSLAFAAASTGWPRRFFRRYAVSAAILTIVFWMAPHSSRLGIMDRVLLPIDRHVSPKSNRGMTELELDRRVHAEDSGQGLDFRMIRHPFISRESQVALGILELGLALPIALLATAIRAPAADRPPPMRSEPS